MIFITLLFIFFGILFFGYSTLVDQEMNLAVGASGESNRQTLTFPLPETTEGEEAAHRGFEKIHGRAWDDVEGLVEVHYPRR